MHPDEETPVEETPAPALRGEIIQGNMPNLFYYVAYKGDVEIGRERVPLHVAKLPPEKQKFLIGLLADKIALKAKKRL